MKLHEDINAFRYMVETISERSGINKAIVEKDYYVTEILSQLARKQDNIKAYFKGGTALYKALKSLGRFSEDIDISVDTKGLTRNQHDKHLKEVTKKYEGLERNPAEGFSYRDSVLSVYNYNSIIDVTPNDALERFGKLKIEATSFTISEPTETLEISSLIYDYANRGERDILETNYRIKPFQIQSISMERLFVDKLFAAETYVKDVETRGIEATKHLYDITVMSELPKIKAFLKDQNAMENVIRIRLREEKLRKGGIPNKLPKDFEMFSIMKNNPQLDKAFQHMQKIYVVFDKDTIPTNQMIKTISTLYTELTKNPAWTKDYSIDEGNRMSVDLTPENKNRAHTNERK